MATERTGPAFSTVALDRAAIQRHDPSWVARQAIAPDSRALAAGGDLVLVDSSEQALARIPVRSGADPGSEPILLGLENGRALFAIDLDALEPGAAARLADGARTMSLRDAGMLLPQAEGGLAAYLVALMNWHRRNRFCANCGNATVIAQGGYSRHCPNCGAVHFPRTDPVVIMLVESAGRLLLGRRSGWPPARYSVLAGFVSPGETLEDAVVREVHEESGIRAYDPSYVASQPWPFPSSLMLGFEAQAEDGEPDTRDGELDDVGWFPREAVRAAALGGDSELMLPPPVSIARFLIDGWLARRSVS